MWTSGSRTEVAKTSTNATSRVADCRFLRVEPHPELLASLPPLLRAAAIGDRDAVDRLVSVGDANLAAEDDWTALHAAAIFDHPKSSHGCWRPVLSSTPDRPTVSRPS